MYTFIKNKIYTLFLLFILNGLILFHPRAVQGSVLCPKLMTDQQVSEEENIFLSKVLPDEETEEITDQQISLEKQLSSLFHITDEESIFFIRVLLYEHGTMVTPTHIDQLREIRNRYESSQDLLNVLPRTEYFPLENSFADLENADTLLKNILCLIHAKSLSLNNLSLVQDITSVLPGPFIHHILQIPLAIYPRLEQQHVVSEHWEASSLAYLRHWHNILCSSKGYSTDNHRLTLALMNLVPALEKFSLPNEHVPIDPEQLLPRINEVLEHISLAIKPYRGREEYLVSCLTQITLLLQTNPLIQKSISVLNMYQQDNQDTNQPPFLRQELLYTTSAALFKPVPEDLELEIPTKEIAHYQSRLKSLIAQKTITYQDLFHLFLFRKLITTSFARNKETPETVQLYVITHIGALVKLMYRDIITSSDLSLLTEFATKIGHGASDLVGICHLLCNPKGSLHKDRLIQRKASLFSHTRTLIQKLPLILEFDPFHTIFNSLYIQSCRLYEEHLDLAEANTMVSFQEPLLYDFEKEFYTSEIDTGDISQESLEPDATLAHIIPTIDAMSKYYDHLAAHEKVSSPIIASLLFLYAGLEYERQIVNVQDQLISPITFSWIQTMDNLIRFCPAYHPLVQLVPSLLARYTMENLYTLSFSSRLAFIENAFSFLYEQVTAIAHIAEEHVVIPVEEDTSEKSLTQIKKIYAQALSTSIVASTLAHATSLEQFMALIENTSRWDTLRNNITISYKLPNAFVRSQVIIRDLKQGKPVDVFTFFHRLTTQIRNMENIRVMQRASGSLFKGSTQDPLFMPLYTLLEEDPQEPDLASPWGQEFAYLQQHMVKKETIRTLQHIKQLLSTTFPVPGSLVEAYEYGSPYTKPHTSVGIVRTLFIFCNQGRINTHDLTTIAQLVETIGSGIVPALAVIDLACIAQDISQKPKNMDLRTYLQTERVLSSLKNIVEIFKVPTQSPRVHVWVNKENSRVQVNICSQIVSELVWALGQSMLHKIDLGQKDPCTMFLTLFLQMSLPLHNLTTTIPDPLKLGPALQLFTFSSLGKTDPEQILTSLAEYVPAISAFYQATSSPHIAPSVYTLFIQKILSLFGNDRIEETNRDNTFLVSSLLEKATGRYTQIASISPVGKENPSLFISQLLSCAIMHSSNQIQDRDYLSLIRDHRVFKKFLNAAQTIASCVKESKGIYFLSSLNLYACLLTVEGMEALAQVLKQTEAIRSLEQRNAALPELLQPYESEELREALEAMVKLVYEDADTPQAVQDNLLVLFDSILAQQIQRQEKSSAIMRKAA